MSQEVESIPSSCGSGTVAGNPERFEAQAPGFDRRAGLPADAARAVARAVLEIAAPGPDDLLVERFQGKIPEEPAVASAEGLEFTAAAPVPDVPIMREPGFEPTLQSSETPTIQIKDPALVMDPHRATMDFTTQFGDTESALPPLPHVEETAAAIEDEELRAVVARAVAAGLARHSSSRPF